MSDEPKQLPPGGMPSPFRFDTGEASPLDAVIIPSEIVAFVKAKLNAKGVIIVATKNAIPCRHEPGEKCPGHPLSIATDGIIHQALPSALDAVKQTVLAKLAENEKFRRREVDSGSES